MSITQSTYSSVPVAVRSTCGETRVPARRDAAKRRVAICLGLLALLMVWAVIFPQTGDGDAIMHFLNARDGFGQPAKLLGSWARVGSKIPLVIPAQFGILAARWMSAIISVLCAWQTIRLADDLGIRQAWLAGPMLIFQPFVFTLAGDTMTELPLALGLVIAIRFWLARRTWASCLVMGYLPTVRPEGFFLCALWGAMVVGTSEAGTWKERGALLISLAWGTAAWLFACWIAHRNLNYFFTEWWSWPADSIHIYGRGSFFAHINRWPLYCGPVLLPLFLVGLAPMARRGKLIAIAAVVLIGVEVLAPVAIRENILPWLALGLAGAIAWSVRGRKFAVCVWVFLLIFGLHSVLWWRGWFGSCGLMRILACVGPITAIVCLRGWNVIAERIIWGRGLIGAFAIAAMGVTALGYYVVEPSHQRIFPLQKASEFVASGGLLANAPAVVLGDPMAQVCLHMRANPQNIVPNDCDRQRECERLLHAPLGSAGIWDNQHAQAWFHVAPSDLPVLGYSILLEVHQKPMVAMQWLEPGNLPRDQVYVVIRKDRAGRMPAGL
jgi:hypothetical protein